MRQWNIHLSREDMHELSTDPYASLNIIVDIKQWLCTKENKKIVYSEPNMR
jgi:hypothetical protein